MTAEQTADLIRRLNQVAHDRRTATDTAQAYCQVALPPLTYGDILEAEEKLGFALPPLFARIYTEVGNGGFGPGNGLLPLHDPRDDGTIVTEYLERISWNERSNLRWRNRMLPIADQGCGEFTCILLCESGDASPPVITFTPNLNTEETTRWFLKGAPYIGPGFLPLLKSFPSWISDWAYNRG